MKILTFHNDFIETAHHLSVRTGLEVVTGEWKPQPHKGYIVFGAENKMDLLLDAQDKLDLVYIIMNSIEPDHFIPLYKELAKKNFLICQNISWLKDLKEMGIAAEYGINEYFYNSPKPERRIQFLLWKEAEYTLPEKKKALFLSRHEEYTVDEITNKMTSCEVYVSTRKNDWDNIHKALASGMNVLSCREDSDMELIYKPFVHFVDKIDLQENYAYPVNTYNHFLTTVATFSLNKMLPVIKDAYIQTEGTKKEQSVTISTGEDEDGRTFADINPQEEENNFSSPV
jgi:hypothetical protein